MIIPASITRRPLIYAMVISLIYLAVSAVAIAGSHAAIANVAMRLPTGHYLEWIQDFVWLVLTTGAFFWLAHGLFARLSRTTELMIEAERRSTAGVITLSLAHDFANALHIAMSHANLLRQSLRDREDIEDAAAVRAALLKADQLLQRIRLAGKSSVGDAVERIAPRKFLQATLALLRAHKEVSSCHLEYRSSELPDCDVNAQLVQDALINLVLNASQACGPGGKIEVRAERVGPKLVIEVHDNGPGIAPDSRKKIFRSFYTTKPDGLGLGMASVTACAQTHCGEVTAHASPMGGALIRLELNVYADRPAA